MCRIINNIVSFALIIGIIFITSDCESYFGGLDLAPITKTSPVGQSEDVEHTHVFHPLPGDLFTEAVENDIQSDCSHIINIGTPLPSFKNKYFTSIWQPPKNS